VGISRFIKESLRFWADLLTASLTNSFFRPLAWILSFAGSR
jgi:hypothetical protein